MKHLLRYLILPPEISSFERAYLARLNRIALIFFWLHLPAFVGVAALAGTSLALAAVLTGFVLIGPTVAYVTLRDPRAMALVSAVTAMIMGGVLVYIGQGPMQIEMHFYFFVLLALLAVFGNPLSVVVAAVTVAVHHAVMWAVFVRGVFNYDASIWTVAVHAAFVVLESVAAVFVARSFFDNVIGLEKIVAARTAELDARNADLRLVLDSVGQGFITVGLDGRVIGTPSRIVGEWFGGAAPDEAIWDIVCRDDAAAAGWMQLGWEALGDGVLPLPLALDQLPRERVYGERTLRIEYRPVGADDPPAKLVVIITDATAEVAREAAEQVQRELSAALERSARDRRGFVEFIAEADRLIAEVEQDRPLPDVRRTIHTIKGNTSLFGVSSVSTKCHAIEAGIIEEARPPSSADRSELDSLWRRYRQRVSPLVGDRVGKVIEVDRDEFDAALAQANDNAALSARLRSWRDEPARPRLVRFGEAAQALAARLGKAELAVEVDAQDVMFDPERWAPFWGAMIHAIRNAVDHGLETSAERIAAGKPATGHLHLSCARRGDRVVIEIADDGRGVDWEAIAARAAAAGLPTDDRRALAAALFADGLSSRAEVSEVSGRGVGMGALRAATEALHGTIDIASVPGQGTRLTFSIPDPVASAAPATRPRRASLRA